MPSHQKHKEFNDQRKKTASHSRGKSDGKFPLSFKETLLALFFGALGGLFAQLLLTLVFGLLRLFIG